MTWLFLFRKDSLLRHRHNSHPRGSSFPVASLQTALSALLVVASSSSYRSGLGTLVGLALSPSLRRVRNDGGGRVSSSRNPAQPRAAVTHMHRHPSDKGEAAHAPRPPQQEPSWSNHRICFQSGLERSDRKRGTPRMRIVPMPQQGILSK